MAERLSEPLSEPPSETADEADLSSPSKRIRVREVSVPCQCSPETYWSLRNDHAFDNFTSGLDGNLHRVVCCSEDDDGLITRVSKVSAIKNPIPPALRGLLGCKDGFSFLITDRWKRNEFGKDCPLTFTTQPAVLADRISVTGTQWVVPEPDGLCRLFFQLSVSVRIKGIGRTVRKGIEEGTIKAYRELPERARQYLALREVEGFKESMAMADGGAADRHALLSPAASPASAVAGGGQTKTNSLVPPSLSALTTATTVPVASSQPDRLPDATPLTAEQSTRARHRWHSALVAVHLRLERAQASFNGGAREGRCIILVDDPVVEGYGISRHVTFRISSRIWRRGECVATAACRHRYSDFVSLQAVLIMSVPNIVLPPLPARKIGSTLSSTIIEERQTMLTDFLQRLVDQPLLRAVDQLASFLSWPEVIKSSQFAHATAFEERRAQAWDSITTHAHAGELDSGVDGFSGVLAGAMMRTAEDAAMIVQRRVRQRSRENTRDESPLLWEKAAAQSPPPPRSESLRSQAPSAGKAPIESSSAPPGSRSASPTSPARVSMTLRQSWGTEAGWPSGSTEGATFSLGEPVRSGRSADSDDAPPAPVPGSMPGAGPHPPGGASNASEAAEDPHLQPVHEPMIASARTPSLLSPAPATGVEMVSPVVMSRLEVLEARLQALEEENRALKAKVGVGGSCCVIQ
jgi:hypothetical protein